MAIFNSYVCLPEGNHTGKKQLATGHFRTATADANAENPASTKSCVYAGAHGTGLVLRLMGGGKDR